MPSYRRLLPRLAGAAAVLALLTAGLTSADAAPAAAPAKTAATDWQPPLSTRGRWIVDARGHRFRLKSANWDGAQGSWTGSGSPDDPAQQHAGQDSHGIPLGLDRVPMDRLMSDFHKVGINSIRLPFSNQMIHDTAAVPDSAVTANPQLRGKTPLQVYDAVVDALTRAGFAVILNDHTNTTRWCCGVDGNERWNSSQSTDQWVDDWVTMARRYAHNPRVVGADLYNEVRRDTLNDPNWGGGDAHDWYAAAQQAADRILTDGNPKLLIVIEGINWTGLPVDGLPHGRPMLTPVRTLSNTLLDAHKLVYSAHVYGYTGPHHSGATGVGETHDPRYQDMDKAQLEKALHDEAFFVTAGGKHYTAPVWISEFGIGAGEKGDAGRKWFGNMADELADHDADFAYWPLVGWDGHDDWALLRYSADGTRQHSVLDADDWRAPAWHHLLTSPSRTGTVPRPTTWRMLSTDHDADAVESRRVRTTGDWDTGSTKAACPDGLRLVGLSRNGHGLCTDAHTSDLRKSEGDQTVVTDESHVHDDWASGYTKLECPSNQFLIGFSRRGPRPSAALCAPARTHLGTTDRTLWFDHTDSRPAGNPGGDYAEGALKGQCANDEYAAGLAYTTRFGADPSPAALLCRPLRG